MSASSSLSPPPVTTPADADQVERSKRKARETLALLEKALAGCAASNATASQLRRRIEYTRSVVSEAATMRSVFLTVRDIMDVLVRLDATDMSATAYTHATRAEYLANQGSKVARENLHEALQAIGTMVDEALHPFGTPPPVAPVHAAVPVRRVAAASSSSQPVRPARPQAASVSTATPAQQAAEKAKREQATREWSYRDSFDTVFEKLRLALKVSGTLLQQMTVKHGTVAPIADSVTPSSTSIASAQASGARLRALLEDEELRVRTPEFLYPLLFNLARTLGASTHSRVILWQMRVVVEGIVAWKLNEPYDDHYYGSKLLRELMRRSAPLSVRSSASLAVPFTAQTLRHLLHVYCWGNAASHLSNSTGVFALMHGSLAEECGVSIRLLEARTREAGQRDADGMARATGVVRQSPELAAAIAARERAEDELRARLATPHPKLTPAQKSKRNEERFAGYLLAPDDVDDPKWSLAIVKACYTRICAVIEEIVPGSAAILGNAPGPTATPPPTPALEHPPAEGHLQ